ncbi:hypothetical protein ACIGXA_03365 [Streptomyces fildesensis]|uniref:Uncharacterized protein n=1 Tax=Streptomyces fildesensis TaxID=375757 RepID=A0ABW8BZE5_9ACTN
MEIINDPPDHEQWIRYSQFWNLPGGQTHWISGLSLDWQLGPWDYLVAEARAWSLLVATEGRGGENAFVSPTWIDRTDLPPLEPTRTRGDDIPFQHRGELSRTHVIGRYVMRKNSDHPRYLELKGSHAACVQGGRAPWPGPNCGPATITDAEILAYLPQTGLVYDSRPKALGGLLHLDSQQDAHHADRFTGPCGL